MSPGAKRETSCKKTAAHPFCMKFCALNQKPWPWNVRGSSVLSMVRSHMSRFHGIQ